MRISTLLPFVAIVLTSLCVPEQVHAYIGPGTGMSAIGVFLAILMGIVVAIFGFLWYPVKRLLRMFRKRVDGKGGQRV
jgi:flagellar biogenesis protein FliO